MERKLKVVGGLPAKLFFRVMPFFFVVVKSARSQYRICLSYDCSHTDFKRSISDLRLM